MIPTQPDVSRRVGRIELDRLLKIIADPFVSRSKEIFPMISPFQIKLMRLGVFCRLRRNRTARSAGESGLQRLGDLFGDVAFDGKNISQFAIVSLRPKMRVVLGIDQLHVNSHLVGRFLNGAFENIGNAELLCDLRNVVG